MTMKQRSESCLSFLAEGADIIGHRRSVRAVLALIVSFAYVVGVAWAGSSPLAVDDVYERERRLVGSEITVEAVVSDVGFAPEFRNGRTFYVLRLSDGGKSLKVLSTVSIFYSEGDRLRVSGLLQRTPGASADLELDATEGILEAVELSERSRKLFVEPRVTQSRAIEIREEQTARTRLLDLASALSAIFAFVAAVGALLTFRFFNLRLDGELLEVLSKRSKGEFEIVVRVFSLGRVAAALSEEGQLRWRGGKLSAVSAQPVTDDSSRAPSWPLIVGDAVIRLTFPIPSEPDMTRGQVWLVIKDRSSRKRFRISLEAERLREAIEGMNAEEHSAGFPCEPVKFFHVPGSIRYHHSLSCPSLSRTPSQNIQSVEPEWACNIGLRVCRVCESRETA